MSSEHSTIKLSWFEQTRALIVTVCCLLSAILNWGNHWLLSTALVIGVVVCGTIAFFDLKQAFSSRKKARSH